MAEKQSKAPFAPKKWCGIPKCGTSIQQKEFACPKHWKKIPKEVRDKIWKAFEARDWITLQEAHNEARLAVASKEGGAA